MNFDKQIKDYIDKRKETERMIADMIDEKNYLSDTILVGRDYIELLNKRIQELMESEGVKSTPILEGDEEVGTVMLADSPPSLNVPDINAIPEEFTRVKVEADKKKIKKHLKDHKVNWATLEKGKKHIKIT